MWVIPKDHEEPRRCCCNNPFLILDLAEKARRAEDRVHRLVQHGVLECQVRLSGRDNDLVISVQRQPEEIGL